MKIDPEFGLNVLHGFICSTASATQEMSSAAQTVDVSVARILRPAALTKKNRKTLACCFRATKRQHLMVERLVAASLG
jgi:hypothetical protein